MTGRSSSSSPTRPAWSPRGPPGYVSFGLTCLSGLRVFRPVLKASPRHLADAAALVFRRGPPGVIKIGRRQQGVGQQEVGEITSVTAFFPDEALQQLLVVG